MIRHTTEKFRIDRCTGLTFESYESGCIRVIDGAETVELYGIGLDKLNEAIRSYVRAQAYDYSREGLERSSAFLSELQDEVAQVLSKVQKELASKAEA